MTTLIEVIAFSISTHVERLYHTETYYLYFVKIGLINVIYI